MSPRASAAPGDGEDSYRTSLDGGDPPPFRPSHRPRILADSRAREHIRERHIDRSSDGTLFPEDWSESQVWGVVDAVLADPAHIRRSNQFINFYGRVDDRRIIVRILEHKPDRIHSAHPIDGPGVYRNGKPMSLPPSAYLGVPW